MAPNRVHWRELVEGGDLQAAQEESCTHDAVILNTSFSRCVCDVSGVLDLLFRSR